MTTTNLIARSFPLLTPGQRDELLGLTESVAVEEGSILLREGDRADAIYLITDGLATVTRNVSGVDVVVSEVVEGELVGEVSFAGNFAATATVTASTDMAALRIDGRRLTTLLDGNPALGMGVYRSIAATLSQRLLNLTDRFAFLAT